MTAAMCDYSEPVVSWCRDPLDAGAGDGGARLERTKEGGPVDVDPGLRLVKSGNRVLRETHRAPIEDVIADLYRDWRSA
jgi:hypothetical protein